MDLKFCFSWTVFLSLVALSAVQRVHRTCERCSRSPSSCRRVSGIYTVTVLTEGTYNPVVEIPASACSINITELGGSRNYIAVKTAGNRGIINSYWALGQPGQYFGAGTRFAYDRKSGNCRGSCIYAEGPTLEKIIIQLLYYDNNPGISYEFVLPNSVSFRPFDGTQSRISGRSSSSSSPSSSSSSSAAAATSGLVPRISASSSSSSKENRHRYRQHQRRRGHPSSTRPVYRASNANSKREYYTGSQTSRSEGRPDVTAAAEGNSASYRRRVLPNQRNPYDYTLSKYGSHTLGGRGLSYTAANSAKATDQRRPTNAKVERYISGASTRVRKISAPQYRPASKSNRLTYSRQQPRYQSLTAKTSHRNEASQPVTSRYYNSGRSSSRGYERGGQFRWKISGLTKCSRDCGGGVQKTNVVCVSLSSRKVVVTPENCDSSLKPRVQTVECNTSPCEAKWEADKWSECSVSCGSGTQTRQIECRQRFSPSLTLRVSADQCGQHRKPAVAQQCEMGLCSTWSTGEWGQCTKDCGGGERRRDVRCVDGFDSPIPGNYCTEARPKHREECNTQQCKAKWWTSDWSSACSESCGSGYQVRSALCMSGEGSVTSESRCRKKDFPDLTKTCYGDSTCRGTWFVGSWGRCSTKCGKGTKRRPVICLQPKPGGNVVVAAGKCNANLKPASEEPCVNTDCKSLWFTSPWSKCSVMCGDGYKHREVSCIDKDGNPSDKCESTIKPEPQEVCSLESCNLYQGTDGRLKNTYDDNPQLEFRESESEAKSEKYKGLKEENKSRNQKQTEKKGDDFEVESYSDSRDSQEPQPQEESGPSYESSEEYDEDSDELEKEVETTSDKACKDKYWNCLMVIQSRLCHYDYYKDLCCVSCRER